jgi:hypothetical protein
VDLPGAPFQWAAAGYQGAIRSGGSKTICGVLFGSAAFLGFLCGRGQDAAPAVDDPTRQQAIAAVNGLFNGFLERFGATECHTLTGCDHSIPEQTDRFYQDEVYRDSCLPQLEHVLSYCLDQVELIAGTDALQVGRSTEERSDPHS